MLSQGSSAWNSAGWNWGYANGTAHDVAARTRRMLATPSQRKAWLEDTMGGRTEIGEVSRAQKPSTAFATHNRELTARYWLVCGGVSNTGTAPVA